MLVDSLEPLGADFQSNPAFFAGQPEAMFGNIGVPATARLAVGVRDIVAECGFAPRYFANVGHRQISIT